MPAQRPADEPEMTPTELARRLADGPPVEVLDIRPMDQREEWWIPGSRHLDVYDAVDEDDPGPLADLEVPGKGRRPVVVVCARGRTSALAAGHLRDRGIDARSLTGGMHAWSLASNAAPVDLGEGARVVQVRRTGKGCLSYIVASADGDAAVVDPSLPPDRYLREAKARGWTVRHVLETHVHADHLSRAPSLADEAGAPLHLPDQDRVQVPFEPLGDGDVLLLGDGEVRIEVLATPGHTPEGVSYLVDDRALLTGDTLFLDGVGRPDLGTDAEGARDRARTLHASLERLFSLDPETLVLPGHTGRPVPFDGAPVADRLDAVRERVRIGPDAEAFADRLLANSPPAPPNHDAIVASNEEGTLPDDPLALEAGANRCAAGGG